MRYIGLDTFIFRDRESAERFRQELRMNGLWSSFSIPSGGAYSYGVTIVYTASRVTELT